MGLRDPMTAAEQIARRYYKDNHFDSQTTAERAYFRVLAEWLQRGREIARLSRRLGKARARHQDLIRNIKDLQLRLGLALATNAVDPSAQHRESLQRATPESSSSDCVASPLQGPTPQEAQEEKSLSRLPGVPDVGQPSTRKPRLG